jgi:hypothetical protein
MNKLNGLLTVVVAGLLMGGSLAYAHEGEDHTAAVKAANGGQVQVAGGNRFELVVSKDSTEPRDNPVLVYVTDGAGNKVVTAGATGTATLLAGKDKSVVTLAPDGDNRMKGVGKYASAAGLKAVVSITLAGKAAEQARFTPLAAKVDGHTNHTH